MFYVYCVRTAKNSLYIGVSNNPNRRVTQHKLGKGAKFTKDYPGVRPVYAEQFPSLAEARRRERQLKGWTRAKKEALIRGIAPKS